MCRPNVYQRSASRAQRTVEQEVGAVVLARDLGQALSEVEGIVRWAP